MYGRWAHLETVGFEQWVNASTVSMSASSIGADDIEEQSNSNTEPACLEVREVRSGDERDGTGPHPTSEIISGESSEPHSSGGGATDGQEATQDEREPQRRHRPILLRAAWLTVGMLSLAAGAVGIILPGLPTTPFILLSAFCFARSSDKFLSWLTDSKLFGPIIREWNANRALPSRRVKICAISFSVVCFGASIVYFAIFSTVWWVSIILGVLCILVCTFLVSLPVTSSSISNEDIPIES